MTNNYREIQNLFPTTTKTTHTHTQKVDYVLANRPGPFVHGFHQCMDKFQHAQFIFGIIRTGIVGFGPDNKKQGCVASINHLVTPIFQKTALQFRSTQTFANNFRFQCDPFFHDDPFIIRGKPCLTLFVTIQTNKQTNETKKSWVAIQEGKKERTL